MILVRAGSALVEAAGRAWYLASNVRPALIPCVLLFAAVAAAQDGKPVESATPEPALVASTPAPLTESAAPAALAPDAPLSGPAPVEVAVLLDTSGSLRPADLEATRALARAVFASLPPGSRLAVLSFDDESRVLQPATADPDAVDRALSGATRAGRFTALHDALFDASRLLRDSDSQRRAILLLSDGKDENSAVNVEDGLQIAQAEAIPVFAVGLGKIDEKSLRRIAKLTDGSYSPLGEASGQEVAALIAQLPVRAPRPAGPAAAADAPAQGVATPEALASGQLERIGAAALATLGFALAVGALLLWRRQNAPQPAQPQPPAPPPVRSVSRAMARDSGSTLPSMPAAKPDADREGATLLTRLPQVGAAGGTVVLKSTPMLRVKNGPGAGLLLELSEATAISLGRSPGNDIVLEDDAVSGQHARIRCEDGAFVVHDLQSTNGTFVNERRVERHTLVNGDVVRLGETLMEFVRFGR